MPKKSEKKSNSVKKQPPIHKILLILFSLFFFLGLMIYIVYLHRSVEKKTVEKSLPILTPPGTIEEKQVYTNKQYGFTLEYPKKWTYREFDGGVAFRRKDKVNDYAHEFIIVRVSSKVGEYQSKSLEAYAKIAGPLEIQKYKSLKGFRSIKTSSGVVGYEAYWNYVTLDGKPDVSDPITYLALPADTTKTIEISLENGKYYDIYEGMTESLAYTK